MKRKALFLLLVSSSLITCKKEKEEGKALFWYETNGTDAKVTVDSQIGYVTSYYSGAPDCGASGCANFTLEVGTYNYHAESTFSSWDGQITISDDGCTKVLLQ